MDYAVISKTNRRPQVQESWKSKAANSTETCLFLEKEKREFENSAAHEVHSQRYPVTLQVGSADLELSCRICWQKETGRYTCAGMQCLTTRCAVFGMFGVVKVVDITDLGCSSRTMSLSSLRCIM